MNARDDSAATATPFVGARTMGVLERGRVALAPVTDKLLGPTVTDADAATAGMNTFEREADALISRQGTRGAQTIVRAAVLAVAALLAWAMRAPMFTLRAIRIEGDTGRSSVATIRANALPMLTGNFFTLDLRVARTMWSRGPARLSAFVEVFNALNTMNLGGYSGNLSSPLSFGQPTSRVGQAFGSGGPRSAQIGVRAIF